MLPYFGPQFYRQRLTVIDRCDRRKFAKCDKRHVHRRCQDLIRCASRYWGLEYRLVLQRCSKYSTDIGKHPRSLHRAAQLLGAGSGSDWDSSSGSGPNSASAGNRLLCGWISAAQAGGNAAVTSFALPRSDASAWMRRSADVKSLVSGVLERMENPSPSIPQARCQEAKPIL